MLCIRPRTWDGTGCSWVKDQRFQQFLQGEICGQTQALTMGNCRRIALFTGRTYYFLVLLLCCCGASAAIHVPSQLEFHHYDHETVQLFNKGTYQSINTETNYLLFQHFSTPVTVLEFPLARTEYMMNSGASICTMDRVKNNDRDAKYLFSKPVNFYLGYRLFQLAELPAVSPQLLTRKGEVRSIVQVLLSMPKAKLLVPEYFSFGDILDQQLHQLPEHQLLKFSTTHYHSNFLGMFGSKRAEFVIAYPTEMSIFMNNKPGLKIRSYGIADSPELITGHMMCTDTVRNRLFIQAVDKVLTVLYREKSFLLAHTRYLDEQSAKHISQLIRQYAAEQ